MGRKDVLAAGGRKASYPVSGHAGDEITIRTAMSEKDRKKAEQETRALQARIDAEKPAAIARKKFIPTKGVLLVRRQEAAATSILLEGAPVEKEQPAEGTVLEVGPGSEVALGSHVVFGKYSGV